MKKSIVKFFLLIIVPGMVLFSCNKDDFSEKDALDAQQTIDLALTVVDASSSMTPVAGATVKLLVDSSFVTRVTNDNGTVVFPGIKISDETVAYVSKAEYTTVLADIDVDPDSYREKLATEIITVYSLSSDKIASFTGRLTMQSDMTDRDREPATGVVVKARNNSMNWGTEEIFLATTDNDGKYTISVPVSSNGDSFIIYYPEFTVNQKLAVIKSDGTREVVERPVLYKSNDSPQFSIPSIPSVYATVQAPGTSGTGFTLASKVNRVSLSSGLTSSLIDGGAGYNGGASIANTLIPFSADPNGNIATMQVDITSGKITNIDWVNDNGATYSTAPTLNLSTLSPTTPATIVLNFRTSYKIYISNRGSNYTGFPHVAVEAETFNGYGVRTKIVDSDVNDGSNSIIGSSWLLTSYTTIYNGMIKGNTGNGDTLLVSSSSFSSAPVFTVNTSTSRRAILFVNVDSDSTLSSVGISISGSGYNPTTPPVITLATLAGYGTGAVAKATVNDNGTLSSVYVTSKGMGYVRNVNDFRKNGTTSDTNENPDWPQTSYSGVKPGDKIVQDVYYGTGYQILNQNAK
jgi:hypothetical protein